MEPVFEDCCLSGDFSGQRHAAGDTSAREKVRLGIAATTRRREAGAWDAAGAAAGSMGLAAFALMIWKFLPVGHVWSVFTGCLAAWTVVSVALWWFARNIGSIPEYSWRYFFFAVRMPALVRRRAFAGAGDVEDAVSFAVNS